MAFQSRIVFNSSQLLHKYDVLGSRVILAFVERRVRALPSLNCRMFSVSQLVDSRIDVHGGLFDDMTVFKPQRN